MVHIFMGCIIILHSERMVYIQVGGNRTLIIMEMLNGGVQLMKNESGNEILRITLFGYIDCNVQWSRKHYKSTAICT